MSDKDFRTFRVYSSNCYLTGACFRVSWFPTFGPSFRKESQGSCKDEAMIKILALQEEFLWNPL